MKRILIISILLTAAAGGVYFFYLKPTLNNHDLTLHGNVDIRDVNLGFRVFGRLDQMNFEEGDRVKKGDKLASLDKLPYEDNLKSAKADVENKTAIYDNTKLNLERKKELLKTNTVSQQSYDDALTAYNTARAGLHVAEANLAQANINYADTDILAPTDGTLITRVREPGSIVQPGESIYVLSVDQPVWVRTYVGEKDLGSVAPGMKAKIYTDSRPNEPYEGQVGFISPVAEFTPKTVETTELRTKLVYRLRITIDNKDNTLRQGMPVSIKLEPGHANDRR